MRKDLDLDDESRSDSPTVSIKGTTRGDLTCTPGGSQPQLCRPARLLQAAGAGKGVAGVSDPCKDGRF